MEYKIRSKMVNLFTAVFDFAVALLMMISAIQNRSPLFFFAGVLFVGVGVYFLRYYERQRRLEKMTPEERAAFFRAGGAKLMANEAEHYTERGKGN